MYGHQKEIEGKYYTPESKNWVLPVKQLSMQTQGSMYQGIMIIPTKWIIYGHTEKCQPSDNSIRGNILGISTLRNYMTIISKLSH